MTSFIDAHNGIRIAQNEISNYQNYLSHKLIIEAVSLSPQPTAQNNPTPPDMMDTGPSADPSRDCQVCACTACWAEWWLSCPFSRVAVSGWRGVAICSLLEQVARGEGHSEEISEECLLAVEWGVWQERGHLRTWQQHKKALLWSVSSDFGLYWITKQYYEETGIKFDFF